MEMLASYFTVDNVARFLTIGGGIIGFVVFVRNELTQLRADISRIDDKLKIFQDSIKHLSDILTQIAVQNVRLNMIEKDIDELRHRKGFID